MTVFIKYCGGCNPLYDRVQFINELKKSFNGSGIRFVSYEDDGEYDAGVVAQGCFRECVRETRLNCKRKFYVKQRSDWDHVRSGLLSLIKNTTE